MCPKPPITPWPAALSDEYRERGSSLAKILTQWKERCVCCLRESSSGEQRYNIKYDSGSHAAVTWNLAKHLRTASSSSVITYSPAWMTIRLTRVRPVLVVVQPRRLSPISRSSLVPKTLRYGRGIIYWVISSTNQLSNYSPLQLGVWCISSPQDLGHDALWHFVSHKQAAALRLNIGGVNLWMRSVFRQMNVSMPSHPACSEQCYSFTAQRLSIGVNVALK